jgi:hypothetical protein
MTKIFIRLISLFAIFFVFYFFTSSTFALSDGSVWTEVENDLLNEPTLDEPTLASLPPLNAHSSVVYDDKMWVIGGDGEDNKSRKVYYSTESD